MTQWVENPRGGRERGPRGLLRAWVEVLVRPRRFFRNGVAPGDQAPGLAFAIAVTFVYVGSQMAFAPAAISGYERIAAATGSVYLSGAIVLGIACFLVAPLALHLAAALGTLSLLPVVNNRAGVSETVQVIGYATAPAVFAAVPIPGVQLVAVLYGCVLLILGFSVVHETSLPRAIVAGFVPAMFVFGLAFGGIAAFEAVSGVAITPTSATG
ncbi:YIP1 family protein [Natronomonas sp.]|uniref:YIP1 family protein n=1 Tax=Natronomonas sp. TaxID=2184060 RepID=UPI002FC2B1F9